MSQDTREQSTNFSSIPVPRSARRSFWSVGFVMLGFTFFSASMSVGARLGNGLHLSGFIVSCAIGGIILAGYTGALGWIGARTGMSLDLLARRAFGPRGSYLPSALIALTQMGWFGVGVAMFALPTGEKFGMSPWPIVLVTGALMTLSAYKGIRAIEIVSFISVPLIALLGTYSIVTQISHSNGLSAMFAQAGEMPVITGIGLVIGSFISGGSATPNFTRFAKTASSALITTVIAFLIGNTLMFTFGAVGGAATGKDDIFYVMLAQGLLLPALIVLGANIWTTNNNALYTTGLGFANITGLPSRFLVLGAGALGTLTSLWLYDNFVGWLTFLSAALPPIGAIIIADYAVNHRDYDGSEPAGIHVGAIAGVILGGLAGWFIPAGIASINAMLVALAAYAVGEWWRRRAS